MNDSRKAQIFLVLNLFILMAVCTAGAFSISMIRRQSVEEATIMRDTEKELASIQRENDYWSTQIAKLLSPSELRARSINKLQAPDPEKIIYAYREFDAANPDKPRVVASYKKTGAAKTVQTARR